MTCNKTLAFAFQTRNHWKAATERLRTQSIICCVPGTTKNKGNNNFCLLQWQCISRGSLGCFQACLERSSLCAEQDVTDNIMITTYSHIPCPCHCGNVGPHGMLGSRKWPKVHDQATLVNQTCNLSTNKNLPWPNAQIGSRRTKTTSARMYPIQWRCNQ